MIDDKTTTNDPFALDPKLSGSHKPTTINNTATMPTVPSAKPPSVPTLIIEHVQVALSLRGIERTIWGILVILGVLTLIDVAELASIMWLVGHVR